MARASDDGTGELAISVTMDGGRVVIRPSGRLDADAIETVRGLLAGARAAGAAAVVDVGLVDRRDRGDVLAALERSDAGAPAVGVA